MEDKKIECANSLCKFTGKHRDLMKVRDDKQSDELGFNIYSRACPVCGHDEYYDID